MNERDKTRGNKQEVKGAEQKKTRERERDRVAYRIFFWGGGGGGGGRGDLTDDLRMYMRRCHAYILINKSHNNAVISFCLCM